MFRIFIEFSTQELSHNAYTHAQTHDHAKPKSDDAMHGERGDIYENRTVLGRVQRVFHSRFSHTALCR